VAAAAAAAAVTGNGAASVVKVVVVPHFSLFRHCRALAGSPFLTRRVAFS
jgi:hypothetical protein